MFVFDWCFVFGVLLFFGGFLLVISFSVLCVDSKLWFRVVKNKIIFLKALSPVCCLGGFSNIRQGIRTTSKGSIFLGWFFLSSLGCLGI